MSYYLLKYFYSNNYEQFTGFNVDFDKEIDKEVFKIGHKPNNDIKIQKISGFFKLDSSIQIFDFDFFKSTDGFIIASEEFCSILKKFQNDISFIDCYGTFHTGEPLKKKYFIVIPNKIYDVFDFDKSEYGGKTIALNRIKKGENPQLIRNLTKIIIKNKYESQLNFFYLKNILLLEPIISEPFLNALLEADLKISYIKL